MPTLAVRDADLDFDVTSVAGGGGPAVVQLHGLTSSRARERLLRLDLARGIDDGLAGPARILRFDARGHGSSTGRHLTDDYRWDRLAEDLVSLLDHVFPGEQVHGIGPSMGTGTLLHAATSAPDRFASLTCAIPPTAWETRRSQAALYETQAAYVAASGVEAFVAAGRLAPRPPAIADVPETMPDVEESLLPTVMRGAALTDLPTPAAIAALAVPALLLAWTDDPAHPTATARILHGLLHGSRLLVASSPDEVSAWPSAFAAHVKAATR